MRRALAVLVMLGCAAGFAEQRSIVLRDGVGGVEGRLRSRQQRSYSLQVTSPSLTIEMSVDPIRSAAVELYDPDGARVLLIKEGAGRWTAAAPKPGTYSLVVVRAVASAPATYYRLKVSAHR